jgi:uncharacterized protein
MIGVQMPRVVHFEIHAENPERAVRFYSACFGWEFTRWGEEKYWLARTGPESARGIDGGVLLRRGAPPADGQPVNAFVCTVDVPNLDESLRQVNENGGRLAVEKVEMPNIGWLAYVKDTEGNILGLMQSTR